MATKTKPKQSEEEKKGRYVAKNMIDSLKNQTPGFYEDIANYGISTALFNCGYLKRGEA